MIWIQLASTIIGQNLNWLIYCPAGWSLKIAWESGLTTLKASVKLFDKVLTPESRKKLAAETNISGVEVLELTKLTDLSRIKWVGATFARMLFYVGIDSVEKASKADYVELYQKIIHINKENNFYKGQIGLHDMKLFVDAAKEVAIEIHY